MLRLEKMPILVGVDALLERFKVSPRFRSAVIDHLAMILVLMLVCSPLFVYVVYQTARHGVPPSTDTQVWFLIYAALANSIYINKDVFIGRSIGKRICGLQIIHRKRNEVAGPIRCMFRNITIVAWPLEVIMLLVTKNRRLGDFIANTEVIAYREINRVKISWLQVISAILIGSALFFAFFKLNPLQG